MYKSEQAWPVCLITHSRYWNVQSQNIQQTNAQISTHSGYVSRGSWMKDRNIIRDQGNSTHTSSHYTTPPLLLLLGLLQVSEAEEI